MHKIKRSFVPTALLLGALALAACQPPITAERGIDPGTDVMMLETGMSPKELIYVMGIDGID